MHARPVYRPSPEVEVQEAHESLTCTRSIAEDKCSRLIEQYMGSSTRLRSGRQYVHVETSSAEPLQRLDVVIPVRARGRREHERHRALHHARER
jgi:hypothetical protein